MSEILLAKGGGGGGGGHASSSSHSSSSSSRSSSSSSSSSSKGTSSAKPGSSIKTSSGATVKSSSAKPANSKYSNSTGVVGDNGYTPRFGNGYRAPEGSVVYYPSHSFIDYLPWFYLFSHNSPSSDAATIVQPDGKQIVAPPEKGVDGMAIFNWILLVVMLAAVIAGIVWGVNKITLNKEKQSNVR